MADNFFKVRNGINFGSLASAPSNPQNGDVYYDTTIGGFQAYQNGAWGALGSGSGTGGGDDIDSLNYSASFTELFPVTPVTGGSLNVAAGFTRAIYSAAKSMMVISYDASKTVTGTGTAMTLSGTPAYTVQTGDMLIVNGVARKITVVTTQTSYTIEAAFPLNPTGAAACVSQAVHSVDLNNFAGDGVAISSALTDNVAQLLVNYNDQSTSNSNFPAFNVAPNTAWSASSDNSTWSSVISKPTLLTTQNNSVTLPSSSTGCYIRFFANKTTGSGTVNLINFKIFSHYQAQTATASPQFANVTLNSGVITTKQLSATPTAPSSTYENLYVKTDGKLYAQDSTGAEKVVGGSSGSKNYMSSYLPSSNNVTNPGNGDFESKTTAGWNTAHVSLSSVFPNVTAAPNNAFANGYYIFQIPSSSVTLGAIYTNNGQTFTVAQSITSNTMLVCSGTGTPLSSGTLTKSSGTGPSTLAFTSFINTNAAGTYSISAVTTGQLAATASGAITSSASSTAGDMMVSSPFFIDLEDQAKMLTFSLAYSVISGAANLSLGGNSSNSLMILIYDVTNGAWIQPQGVYNLVQNSGVGIARGTFQSTSNSTQYQICVMNANASTGAFTLYLDDVFVGPQTAPSGPVMSDWQAYVPTIVGLGSTTLTYAFWRRVGDSLQVSANIVVGTPTGVTATMSLPPGLTIDPSLSSIIPVGLLGRTATNASYESVLVNGNPGGIGVQVFTFGRQDASNGMLSSVLGNNLVGSGETIAFTTIPFRIAGWSSNLNVSSDTDTRVVAAYATSPGGTPSGTFQTIIYGISSVDTHASYSTSTGIYTVPVSGKYSVSATYDFNGSVTAGVNAYILIQKNGSNYAQGAAAAGANNELQPTVTAIMDCKAGDTIQIQGKFLGSVTTPVWSGSFSNLSIQRLSGPAVVAATEAVNAHYQSTQTTSFVTNGTILNFDTKVFDSHNAVTTGGSWGFKAPVSGTYKVSALVAVNNAQAGTGGQASGIELWKNGVVYEVMGIVTLQQTASVNIFPSGSTSIKLLAGDVLTIRTFSNAATSQGSLSGAQTQNYIAIDRIGN